MLAQLHEEIKTMITAEHPTSGHDLQDTVNFVNSHQLQNLESQSCLAPMIQKCKIVLDARIAGRLTETDVKQAFFNFVLSYKSVYGSDNASRGYQAGVSGRFTTPFSNATELVLRTSVGVAADTKDPFYDEAVGETKVLHEQLTKAKTNEVKKDDEKREEKKRGEVGFDSFDAFEDSYVQLYQVIRSRGWSKNTWSNAVKVCHRTYKTEAGSAMGVELVSAILKLLFASAVDGGKEPDIANDIKLGELQVQVAKEQTEFKELHTILSTVLPNISKLSLADSKQPTVTLARQRRQAAWTRVNPLAVPLGIRALDVGLAVDTTVIHLHNLGHSAEQAVRYVEQPNVQASIIASYPTKNVGPEALLNYLVLISNSPEEVEAQLAGDTSTLKAINEQILSRGSLAQHYQQIKTRWGMGASSAKISADDIVFDRNTNGIPLADGSANTGLALTERGIIELLKKGRINGAFPHYCCDENVLPPLGGVGVRPHMTYLMGTAWMAEGGGKCASTLFGHADFQLADDAARKIHYGHFTMYNKTVIWSRQHIVHGRNIFCKEYHGGNGTAVWDPLDPTDVEEYQFNELIRDIFWLPKPIGFHTNSKHMDITGSYHKDLSPTKQANEETNLPGIGIFAKHWGWSRQQRNPLNCSFWSDASPKMNTICFQAHQGVWNPKTMYPDRVITEKGHWGQNVYPTCGRTRKGGQGHKTFLHCNYAGTSTMQIVKT